MPTAVVGNRHLHYLDAGASANSLMLIHDFPLHSGMWEEQLHEFGGRYRVIAPDLAGCGESDGLGELGQYSIDAWADDVIGVIGSLDLESVTLVGSGAGADVALAVLRRAREQIGAIGLVALRGSATIAEEDHAWSEQARWIAAGGELSSIIDRFVDRLAPMDSPVRAEVIKRARWMMAATSREAWVGGLEALRGRPDPIPDLDKIDTPAMVIVGERDALAPPSDARAVAAGIPGAGIVELQGVGHVPNLEQPGLFNRALDDLLTHRGSRRGSSKHAWPASPATTRKR